jgi:Putative heavy-metal-binding
MASSLPPSAQARLGRFAAGQSRTSLLSVPAAAALAAVGFEPVGDVLGASVRQLSPIIGWNASIERRSARQPGVRLSSHAWSPFRSYVRTLEGGYTEVLRRLGDEAAALGADGVVAIRLTHTRLDGLHEFVALGTAVRARTSTRPGRVFTTDLSGNDFAALLLGGWVPVELQAAVETGLRANDWRTTGQLARNNATNVEVGAYTELTNTVRAAVRTKLARSIARSGADGGVLRRAEVRLWDEGTFEAAEASLIGTAVARFATRARPRPIDTPAVLPVRPSTGGRP